jgi:hypothetical protein
MSPVRHLSDDGTRRHKAKVSLIVLAAVLGIVGIQFAKQPPGLVEGTLLVAVVLGCAVWSIRSTIWFLADSVDLNGRILTVKRGRRTATIPIADVTDVARGAWHQGCTVVIALRSPIGGFGDSVTYRVAGADALTSAELNSVVSRLRAEIGLPSIVEPENTLTAGGRSRLQFKRWALGFVLVLCLPIIANSILSLELFEPYDRQLTAIATLVLAVAVFYGFSPAERDAMMDRRKGNRRSPGH